MTQESSNGSVTTIMHHVFHSPFAPLMSHDAMTSHTDITWCNIFVIMHNPTDFGKPVRSLGLWSLYIISILGNCFRSFFSTYKPPPNVKSMTIQNYFINKMHLSYICRYVLLWIRTCSFSVSISQLSRPDIFICVFHYLHTYICAQNIVIVTGKIHLRWPFLILPLSNHETSNS